jgi:hypothetical protein
MYVTHNVLCWQYLVCIIIIITNFSFVTRLFVPRYVVTLCFQSYYMWTSQIKQLFALFFFLSVVWTYRRVILGTRFRINMFISKNLKMAGNYISLYITDLVKKFHCSIYIYKIFYSVKLDAVSFLRYATSIQFSITHYEDYNSETPW